MLLLPIDTPKGFMVVNVSSFSYLNAPSVDQRWDRPEAWRPPLDRLQFDYQMSFDKYQMGREDTQLQRFVNDAEQAGVSPIAAMGKAGSYGAIGSQTGSSGQSAAQGMASRMAAMQAGANVAKMHAEKDLLKAQAANARADAGLKTQQGVAVSGGEQRARELHAGNVGLLSRQVDESRSRAALNDVNRELAGVLARSNVSLNDARAQQARVAARVEEETGIARAVAEMAVAYAQANLAGERRLMTSHDRGIYEALGVPSNIGWDVVTRAGLLTRGALLNALDLDKNSLLYKAFVAVGLVEDKTVDTSVRYRASDDDMVSPHQDDEERERMKEHFGVGNEASGH